jgi:hypothetical protein
MTLCYFAHVTAAGTIRYRQVPGSIGVLEAPDQSMPIGMGSEGGWDGDGLLVWRLRIWGAEVQGQRVDSHAGQAYGLCPCRFIEPTPLHCRSHVIS